jgi:hypothetical protein
MSFIAFKAHVILTSTRTNKSVSLPFAKFVRSCLFVRNSMTTQSIVNKPHMEVDFTEIN